MSVTPPDDYDDIDRFVDDLFRNGQNQGSGETGAPLRGEVLSGDWRIDRIDQVIQDTYNEALWWHNNRISEGCDPRSGLRNLPYVPWDENIDGVAAMQGAIGGLSESSYTRNGGHVMTTSQAARSDGLTCGEAALIVGVVVGLFLFMAVWA